MLKSSYSNKYREAGLDEVGRGCLAGPVVAAAVILPLDYQHSHLKDSKKLSSKLRTKIQAEIKQEALAWAVAEVSPQEIDQINILQASFLAMHQAVDQLHPPPELLLVDGKLFKPYPFISHQCIIKGDNAYFSIAAASVLAKIYRDELMQKLATEYPQYGWENNVGYPTPKHRDAIKKYGLTPWHRKSFKLKT